MGCCGKESIEELKDPIQIKMPKNNPLNFQLILKMKFDKNIISIKELSKDYIGILFGGNLLSIYNLNTFKKINEIEIICTKYINNFIVLENLDLVFWTDEKICFYNLSEKKYVKYQEIDESIQEKKDDVNEFFYFRYSRAGNKEKENYKINSICQIKNGNLVSCNSFGIKIYSKEKDKYILKSKNKINRGVKNAFEIDLNKFVFNQEARYSGGHCSMSYYSYYNCPLFIYDNEKNIITKLNEYRKCVHYEISYFKNDKYLFVKNGNFKFDIYDINQNMKSINQNNEIIENYEIKENNNLRREISYGERDKITKIKDEMNIRFLCEYSEDFFFAQDINDDIKIYKFKDKSFEVHKNFASIITNFENSCSKFWVTSFWKDNNSKLPARYRKEIKGMIKLKNNNLIIYSYDSAFVIKNY